MTKDSYKLSRCESLSASFIGTIDRATDTLKDIVMYQQEPGMQHIGKAWNHGQRVSASFIGTIVRATDTLKDIVMY